MKQYYQPENLILQALEEQKSLLTKLLAAFDKLSPHPITSHMTVKQAAAVLHRSSKTIRAWIASGKIEAIKLNQGLPQDQYYISKEAIDKLIHQPQFPFKGERRTMQSK